MLHKVYTVFDVKAGAYMQPFFVQSKGLAIRSFTDVVNDPKHNFNKYPEDFTLFEIGEYDDVSGKLIPHQVNHPVGTALEFIKSS